MTVQANWRITFNIENEKVEVISIEDMLRLTQQTGVN
jgi:hypothetical protein